MSHTLFTDVHIPKRVIESNMNFPRNSYIQQARSEKHSYRFIRDTVDYADNLMQKGLPVIFSPRHLALLVDVEFIKFQDIVKYRDYYYTHYFIKKKRGGHRRIVAPHSNIKVIQEWIKTYILDKVPISSCAMGFAKGRSIVDNAKIHEDQEVILNLDLSNFFETIGLRRIYGVFKSLGYVPNVAMELANICTASIPNDLFSSMPAQEAKRLWNISKREPVLAQGAPTSPGISNIVCRRLDKRLSGLANRYGVNYSRYADDITFSGKAENMPNVRVIRKIIENEKFIINWNKVGKYGRGQKQMVTGLLINGGVRIPKKYKKEIYRHLYFCQKYGAVSHFNRIAPGKGYGKDWLLGKIRFVHSVEPA